MRYGNAKDRKLPAKRKIRSTNCCSRAQSSAPQRCILAQSRSQPEDSSREMSLQIATVRVEFMMHLCSPRNALKCKAKRITEAEATDA